MTRILRTLLLTAVAALPLLGAADAHGQTVSCGNREAMLLVLAQRFDEAPRAIGLDRNGRVMEIVAAESGSWSLLVTAPNGRTCLVASGTAFSILPEPEEVSDDPVS
ncbi:MAG: hypothetical protein ACTS3R_03195 [Inquilinaceae bacterium]